MPPHFSLRVSSSPEFKVIVSVSKKVCKLAVERNTVRRRVKAVMINLKKDLKPGLYHFSAKSGSIEVLGKELEGEIRGLCKV